MKIFNKKIILLTLPILTAATYMLCKKIYKPNPIEYAHQYVAHQEQQTWNALTSVDIEKETLESKANQLEPALLKQQKETKSSGTVSQETKDFALSILSSCGIDTKNILVVATDMESPAAATETVLYINEKLLKSYSKNVQHFILGHEAQHMIHKDYLNKWALTNVMKDKNVSYERDEVNDPSNCYSRFCEWRADVNSALKGKEFAEGYLEFVQSMVDEDYFNPGTTHPLDSERLALAKEIYSEVAQA
ncbi:MAG TPA: hypothetical protein VHO47_03125 [Candidatus Babeliales bacterium]|nr:hypothetical protein [Candidatus Babeliales bacterium]